MKQDGFIGAQLVREAVLLAPSNCNENVPKIS